MHIQRGNHDLEAADYHWARCYPNTGYKVKDWFKTHLSEYLKATECLKKAINYDEKNNKYLGLIGCCLFNTGDYENAFNYSRKAFELDNRNLDAIITLGKIELFRHNYNEAYMYINLAVEIDNNNYEAIRLLSKYYIAKLLIKRTSRCIKYTKFILS